MVDEGKKYGVRIEMYNIYPSFLVEIISDYVNKDAEIFFYILILREFLSPRPGYSKTFFPESFVQKKFGFPVVK